MICTLQTKKQKNKKKNTPRWPSGYSVRFERGDPVSLEYFGTRINRNRFPKILGYFGTIPIYPILVTPFGPSVRECIISKETNR